MPMTLAEKTAKMEADEQANAAVGHEMLVELRNKIEPVKQLYYLSKTSPEARDPFEVALRNLFDDVDRMDWFLADNGIVQKHPEMTHFSR